MTNPYATRRIAGILALLAPVVLALGASAASAASRDRTAPTTPTNLVVTGTTSYSVSLAWDASSHKSGDITYVICCTATGSARVQHPATSFTFSAGVEAGRSYSFRVLAVDDSGNASKSSNAVSVTTPADTTPPATPAVTVSGVGATHVDLAWSSIENGPNVWFWVWRDGATILRGATATSASIGLLEPETTYTFTVQARDFAQNWSAVGDPITVTTAARNTRDTTPPTTPANLTDNGMSFPDGETRLFWSPSTDDVTPQSFITYEVYLNGVLDHALFGHGSTILYGTPGALNTFQVVAVDEAGNRSPAASPTIDLR